MKFDHPLLQPLQELFPQWWRDHCNRTKKDESAKQATLKGLEQFFDYVLEYDSEDKTTRWENIRMELFQVDGFLAEIKVSHDDQPDDKDRCYIKAVGLYFQEVVVLVAYLDDYSYPTPVWCTLQCTLR